MSCGLCGADVAEGGPDPEEARVAVVMCVCGAAIIAVPIPSESGLKAGYGNPSSRARQCDFCGKRYHGPAVYCSLDCAVADG